MLTGQISKILTQKEDDWGRYVVMTCNGSIMTVGVIKNASVGMTVVLEGHEEDNAYGHQFKIRSVLTSEADPCSGIRKFLSDGYVSGIGASKANEIISLFGADSLSLFETDEGLEKLKMVRGLGESTIMKAKKSFEENRKYKDIVLFLNGAGTKKQVEDIYEKYGKRAVSILKTDPYRLKKDLDGYGFLRTDSIAMASGIKPYSKSRIMAAFDYVLETAAQGGDCYLTKNELYERTLDLLSPLPKIEGLKEKTVSDALSDWGRIRQKLIKAKRIDASCAEKLDKAYELRKLFEKPFREALKEAINSDELINDDEKIYIPKMYATECDTARLIHEMCSKRPVHLIDEAMIDKAVRIVEENKGSGFKVTKEQRSAVELALNNRMSIISGGPGRGKTAISEIVARCFLMAGGNMDKSDVIMLAPTGRAAQRITQSTGYDAMTVHRALLEAKNGETPKGKLIICDETSMADIYLIQAILRYARDCSLVFLGDVDQIASIGPGKVLKDMIDSKAIPCILLKEGHRNSGTIAENSELINSGSHLKDYKYDEHFVYIPATSKSIADVMIADFKKKVNEYGIKNVMLCVAMKDRGVCSVNKLNSRLQDIFTKGKPEARFGDRIFRVGDRVMQTKNDYDFISVNGKEKRRGIFNGERGTVVQVFFSDEDKNYRIIVNFDDGSMAGYTAKTAVNLTLAYATTLHKCQGSEASCVMMAYTFGDYILLNRSLFYTGETRAKNEFRFYGEEKFRYGKSISVFDLAVAKTGDEKRNTYLCERLKTA